jgi:hypothetical protein
MTNTTERLTDVDWFRIMLNHGQAWLDGNLQVIGDTRDMLEADRRAILAELGATKTERDRWCKRWEKARVERDVAEQKVAGLLAALEKAKASGAKHWPRDGSNSTGDWVSKHHSAFCPGCVVDAAIANAKGAS